MKNLMKKIFLLITITLLLTGCFKDKSEEAIKNCADTIWSKGTTEEFGKASNHGYVYSWNKIPSNIFEETVLELKKAGADYEEVYDWVRGLDNAEITEGNREVINHFIEMKNKINKSIDDHLKLSLTDRLQNKDYEESFSSCEQVRKEASKTFDAKWQKAKIKKVEFR
jgi:hypothetical protein